MGDEDRRVGMVKQMVKETFYFCQRCFACWRFAKHKNRWVAKCICAEMHKTFDISEEPPFAFKDCFLINETTDCVGLHAAIAECACRCGGECSSPQFRMQLFFTRDAVKNRLRLHTRGANAGIIADLAFLRACACSRKAGLPLHSKRVLLCIFISLNSDLPISVNGDTGTAAVLACPHLHLVISTISCSGALWADIHSYLGTLRPSSFEAKELRLEAADPLLTEFPS
mmetsp:Transcript_123565/g.231147  ORF Transcript_123565/g.231147 Transcript_123565/m.231147 type:complete len:227 (-) Transcript_123565:306-986(-)